MLFSTANHMLIESVRPINDMAVSELKLQRQSITRFVSDALQSAVNKHKENSYNTAEKTLADSRKAIVYYCLQKAYEKQQSQPRREQLHTRSKYRELRSTDVYHLHYLPE